MANKYRGEVGVSDLVTGAHLRFTLNDLASIEAEYGVDWWVLIAGSLEAGTVDMKSPVTMCIFLMNLGLRDKAGEVIGAEAFVDHPIKEMYVPLLDAISFSVRGTDFKSFCEELKKQEDETKKKADLLLKEALSNESENGPSELD